MQFLKSENFSNLLVVIGFCVFCLIIAYFGYIGEKESNQHRLDKINAVCEYSPDRCQELLEKLNLW